MTHLTMIIIKLRSLEIPKSSKTLDSPFDPAFRFPRIIPMSRLDAKSLPLLTHQNSQSRILYSIVASRSRIRHVESEKRKIKREREKEREREVGAAGSLRTN